MYIYVKLLQGYQKSLLYAVPDEWPTKPAVGSIVQVPLRAKIIPAFVTRITQEIPADANFAIKAAQALEPFPADEHYVQFLHNLSAYYQLEEHVFIKRIRHFLNQPEIPAEVRTTQTHARYPQKIDLTPEQQHIVDAINPDIINTRYSPNLIHGVTGSGKTEVYKKLIQTAIESGKSVILLLPEVTLALQISTLLTEQLPDSIVIRNFHSATSSKEKKQTWHMLMNRQPIVLIGVHLPILLPIAQLGLIIVDEEHDVGYQEKKHPKINSKEVAIWRAHDYGIPLVLGSATPSIATLANVYQRGWNLFNLKQRYAGAFPTIKTVFLCQRQRRPHFWISHELQKALADRIARKEQSIVFINRRGYSFFLQCSQCSFIPSCPACSVSLTLHEEGILSCHYCGHTTQQPRECAQCKAPEESLIKRGIGTQQVVRILEQLFPQARIGRADMDTTSKKNLWRKTLADFEQGNLDILVGTQTITKGFHFPRVTLVGILWADVNLHFPLYNASETTLQQIIQVAGRAGRQSNESMVIIQTMADHPIFSYLQEAEYLNFYQSEIENRKELGYPPCGRLVEIELKHTIESTVEHDACTLARFLITQQKPHIQILGPSKPPVAKIKHIYMRKIYIKGDNMNTILELLALSKQLTLKSSIFLTPNPLH
jgi:primosomal protein N' (replication factor Y) (superfamily II helicase)